METIIITHWDQTYSLKVLRLDVAFRKDDSNAWYHVAERQILQYSEDSRIDFAVRRANQLTLREQEEHVNISIYYNHRKFFFEDFSSN